MGGLAGVEVGVTVVSLSGDASWMFYKLIKPLKLCADSYVDDMIVFTPK